MRGESEQDTVTALTSPSSRSVVTVTFVLICQKILGCRKADTESNLLAHQLDRRLVRLFSDSNSLINLKMWQNGGVLTKAIFFFF